VFQVRRAVERCWQWLVVRFLLSESNKGSVSVDGSVVIYVTSCTVLYISFRALHSSEVRGIRQFRNVGDCPPFDTP
jgi:hypothetical protein